ncbi:hypothetical protein GF373_17260 [bacterium]|nr:hypothetical protein [bacterium]
MKYTSEKFGFTAQVPDGWRPSEAEHAVTFKPEGEDTGPNITVTPAPDQAPNDLSLHKGGLAFFKKVVQDQIDSTVEFGNEQCFENNGHEAIAFNLAYSYNFDDKLLHVAKMQVFYKKDGQILSITGTTTAEDFEDRYPVFRAFTESVQLL